MKYRIGLLFFMFGLFAVPASDLQACGNADAKKTEQKSCCSPEAKDDVAHCTQNADACDQTHPGESCPPDNDGCGGCHCPGCGTVSHSGATFALETQSLLPLSDLNASLQKQAFYFADHLPEAVYLPIWLPPKI
ncbi:MAG: hypothetical protein KF734_00480 [Saprospiraceae bacterium]|nr:hypothetical protein [Saprospiraceae bacterium]